MVGMMLPTVFAVAIALVIGGSLAAWSHVRVRWWLAAVAAFALLLVLYNPPLERQPWAIAWGPAIWVAARMVIFAVLVRNAVEPGATRAAWALGATGVLLNTIVVVANGGYMPQAGDAHAAVWGIQRVDPDVPERLRNTVVMTSTSRLAWLGDVIPQPSWLPKANVISIGDVLLSLGIAWWAFLTTFTGRRADTPSREVSEAAS